MVTIEVKENSKQAKAFVALAKTLSFVKIRESKSSAKDNFTVSNNIPNAKTAKAIKENNRSKGERSKTVEELFEKLEG